MGRFVSQVGEPDGTILLGAGFDKEIRSLLSDLQWLQVKNEGGPSLGALVFDMLSPPSESVVLSSKLLNGLSSVYIRGKTYRMKHRMN